MKTSYGKLNLFHVPLWETGVAAVCIVVAGYVLLLPRIVDYRVGSLLIKSTWVGGLIAVLGVWSFAMILLKGLRLWRNWQMFDDVLLPEAIDTQITNENALKFIRYLQSRFPRDESHLIRKRFERALQQLAYGHRIADVSQDLQAQSQADADELESSYTMLRAFIWAIPILGFIGTVLGIGQAIGGFASSLRSAEDLATIKSTLGHVVTGLAFAFDTTFLGLVVSLIVMFPMNMMHRAEQSLLTAMEAYYSENLVLRFQHVEGTRLSRAVSEFAHEIKALHHTLSGITNNTGA